MSMSKKPSLKALGASAKTNKGMYRYDKPDPSLLEHFPTPPSPGVLTVRIDVPEFSSLCPLTGQPDFATIRIEYQPKKKCVESKSTKIYLMGFRQHGEFHEACVSRIATDLVNLLDPYYLKVTGEFTPRGGIPFWPSVEYGTWQISSVDKMS